MVLGPFIFWFLMIIWAICGFMGAPARPWSVQVGAAYGGSLVFWILLFIVGAHVFGIPRI